MNIVFLSPVPTHPTTHGNRARVLSVAEALKAAGHKVTLLYLAFRDISPDHFAEMASRFDEVLTVTPPWRQPGGTGKEPSPTGWGLRGQRDYKIDDWAFDAAKQALAALVEGGSVDLIWVNYVWCSFVLEGLGHKCPTLIDTHDIFAGRRKALGKLGLKPSFFYTSHRQERKGLERADYVVAIQDHEAGQLRRRLTVPVTTIGHLARPVPTPRPTPCGMLRVGFLASDNALNRHALDSLMHARRTSDTRHSPIDWRIAGPLATKLEGKLRPPLGDRLTLLGPIQDLTGFYDQIDVAVNPHEGGTGLKIKSVEALLHGCPLVGTEDAMLGLNSSHPMHQLADAAACCAALTELAVDPSPLPALTAAGNAVIGRYSEQQHAALQALLAKIESG